MPDSKAKGKDLVVKETAEQALERYAPNSLPGLMAAHHPIHGLFGIAFEEAGGAARLTEWANDHYGDFVKIFSGMAPKAQRDVTVRQMNIQINSDLRETALDGHAEESQ